MTVGSGPCGEVLRPFWEGDEGLMEVGFPSQVTKEGLTPFVDFGF